MFSGDWMKKDFKRTMEERLSLPSEAMSEVPYLEMKGSKSVSVENHRGISAYTDDEIKINVKRGKILVQGSNLRIVCMNRRRIEVRGTLRAVILESL